MGALKTKTGGKRPRLESFQRVVPQIMVYGLQVEMHLCGS